MPKTKIKPTGKEQKKMSMYIFPVALIALDVGAVYWLAAAVLNVTVTF